MSLYDVNSTARVVCIGNELAARAQQPIGRKVFGRPEPTAEWLAGFIDGEGCFMIFQGGRNGCSPRLKLELQLRDDDHAILETVRDTFDIGMIHRRPARGASNPSVVWTVSNLEDCHALIRLLDRAPLRTKKAADYALWRQAFIEWTSGEDRDRDKVFELRDEISRGRAYSGARTSEDRADELIDMLMGTVADLREGRDLRESVAGIGGRVFAWLEAIDAETAR